MPEILALLTAKTASTEFSGGGIAKLTPEMVAAACSDLRPYRAYLYARLKYMLDETVAPELLKLLIEAAWRKSRRQKWRMAGGEGKHTTKRLVALVLSESIKDRKCRTCKGAGTVKCSERKLLEKTCHVCEGTGNGRELSEDDLSAMLDVSLRRVRFFWRFKYRELMVDMVELDHKINEHVYRHLGKDF